MSKRFEYERRAADVLRTHDPHYDLDNHALVAAIAAEMMKVREESMDEVPSDLPGNLTA